MIIAIYLMLIALLSRSMRQSGVDAGTTAATVGMICISGFAMEYGVPWVFKMLVRWAQ